MWRWAGGLATAAALIAVALVAFAPQTGTMAFARDKAASALMFHTPGHVLHAEMTYTYQSDEDPKDQSLDQRWSLWVDSDGKRLREQLVNKGDGSLADIKVWSGGRELAYWFSNNRQGLVDYDMTARPLQTVMDEEISNMRARIDDGSAKVIGSKTIDGDAYWVIECDSGTGESRENLTMTLRKSDYRPKTWQRKTFSTDSKGATKVTTKRIVFDILEQLEPTTVPENFFSFDAVTAAVRPGVPLQK
jgi:hypothetical protein